MPNPRKRHGDARSRETDFSGLPKIIKMTMRVNENAPGAGVNTILRYDTVAFNYGPFVPRPNVTPPLFDGITVNESGIYYCQGRVFDPGGTGVVYLFLAVNNTVPVVSDGTQPYVSSGNAPAANTVLQVADWFELQAGDVVSTFINVGAVTAVLQANFTSLIVKKEGGQY